MNVESQLPTQEGTRPSSAQISFLAEAVERVLKGETLADIRKVPAEQMEVLFDKASDLVDSEDYDTALDMLLVLVLHDPYDFRFQFGYGLCLQQLGLAQDALRHFRLAYLLDPDDPGCAFRIGECHVALGERGHAIDAFEAAIEMSAPPASAADIRIASEAALLRLNT